MSADVNNDGMLTYDEFSALVGLGFWLVRDQKLGPVEGIVGIEKCSSSVVGFKRRSMLRKC